MFFRQRHHLLKGHFGGETDHLEITGMHPQQGSGARGYRPLVVGGVGAVGGAYLDNLGAASGAIIEVNPQETPLTGAATLSLRGASGEVLPALLDG